MSEEHFLPKTSINKLIKDNISSSVRVSADFRDVIADCGVEFIHIIAGQSKDEAASANRKTLSTDHVIQALKDLGLGAYVEELRVLLDSQRKDGTKKTHNEELSHEEKVRLQRECEEKAKEQIRKQYGDDYLKLMNSSLERGTSFNQEEELDVSDEVQL